MKVTDEMVNRFLSWPLPATVRPDGNYDDPTQRRFLSGTNLLSAEEARQMLEHVLATDGVTRLHEPKENDRG